MRQLHVAVAQINARAGDLAGNQQRMLRQIRSAAAVGVEVILFAETCMHAYDLAPETLALAEPLGGPLTRQLTAWAREYRLAILAGFWERDGERIYNSHAVARPHGSLGVQRKHNITPPEIEAGISAGPRERTVFEFNGVRTAVIICSDSGIEGLSDDLRGQRIKFRFCPTAGGGIIGDKPIPYLHETELADPANRETYHTYRGYVCITKPSMSEEECPVCGFAAANAMGFDGRGVTHMGHCIIVDNHRVLRAQIPGTNVIEHHQDQMVHAVLNFA